MSMQFEFQIQHIFPYIYKFVNYSASIHINKYVWMCSLYECVQLNNAILQNF